VLGMEAFRARRDLPAPIAAVAFAVVAHLVFGDGMLVAAIALFLCYLTARFLLARRGRRA